jgi:hypothetical protein
LKKKAGILYQPKNLENNLPTLTRLCSA